MLTKVLFTVAAVVIVWWLFKAFQRHQAGGLPRQRPHERAAEAARAAVRARMGERGDTADGGQGGKVEDLEQCPACGTWKPAGEKCGCGRG